MEEREEVGVDDSGEILQSMAVSLENGIRRSNLFSHAFPWKPAESVWNVLAKYSEKKGDDTNTFEWKEMEGIFLESNNKLDRT